jgi:23S rRNA pseudouridine2605 synthase
MNNAEMRLSKIMSGAGVASRRDSEELIRAGRVKIDGKIVREPGIKVKQGQKITLNGREIRDTHKKIYVMLNKPRGVVCTCADRYAEVKVTDIVKVGGVRLFPAGRLDKDSEGLILLTNDGDFANKITHPRYGLTKTYKVWTDKKILTDQIFRLIKGVCDEGEFIRAEKIIGLSDNLYIFTMKEGRKREVRRLVRQACANIKRLQRTAIGNLSLDKRLSAGGWRLLTEKEKDSLLEESGKNCP